MFKGMFDKGKCLVGLHQGEWHYLGDGACEQIRICERCGTESRRTEHVWDDWHFLAEGSCDIARVCRRCQEEEHAVEHEWGPARYKYSNACEQVRICNRCHDEQAAGTVHIWGDWQYLDEDDCTLGQICARCQAIQSQTRFAHDWGEWQHSDYYNGTVRVCRHCGEMEIDYYVEEEQPSYSYSDFPTPPQFDYSDVEDMLRRAQAGTDQPASQPSLDPDLIGHWRHTDSMYSDSFSMVTDTHMILGADGRFVRYSRTESSMGSNYSPEEYGSWDVLDGRLRLRYDNGTQLSYEYDAYPDKVFLPNSNQRLWDRVG